MRGQNVGMTMAPEYPQSAQPDPTPRPGKAPGPEHPTLGLLVSDEQRERAVDWLQRAYADNRVSEPEFEERLEQVFAARTRKDLNMAFYGLVDPRPSQALGLHPAYQPLITNEVKETAGRGAASLSYFSALLTGPFGPLVGYMVTPVDSHAKQQAGQAFDFTVMSMGVVIGAGILSSVWGPIAYISAIAMVVWMLVMLIGGAKSASDATWRNPLLKPIPLGLLAKPHRRDPVRRQLGR